MIYQQIHFKEEKNIKQDEILTTELKEDEFEPYKYIGKFYY